ncbi:MAG: hypothetical protein ISS49_00445 [Anaerolineae bacterium]|nr:hypothetical protein [Anaerolineae bacterium]
MAPEAWTTLETPVVLCLSEVCDTLTLTEEERAGVLGPRGSAGAGRHPGDPCRRGARHRTRSPYGTLVNW